MEEKHRNKKILKNSKASIDYSQTIHDIYENLERLYSSKEKERVNSV